VVVAFQIFGRKGKNINVGTSLSNLIQIKHNWIVNIVGDTILSREIIK